MSLSCRESQGFHLISFFIFFSCSANHAALSVLSLFYHSGSCHKYHFCCHKHVFVATNMCLLQQNMSCLDKHSFATKVLSQQTYFAGTKLLSLQIFVMTNGILLQQKFFHNRLIFVATNTCDNMTTIFCHNKHTFVVTNMCLSQ